MLQTWKRFCYDTLQILPVPSCSKWWQRWTSRCASCRHTPRDGTNQGAKHESTRVQAASAIGDTSWSQGNWDPHSLSELEGKRWYRKPKKFTIVKETAINEENFKLTAPCESKMISYVNNIEKNILIYDWDSVLDSFKKNSKWFSIKLCFF